MQNQPSAHPDEVPTAAIPPSRGPGGAEAAPGAGVTSRAAAGVDDGDRALPRTLSDARVGPYHLLRILGEGGFGMVYLAERREPFTQQVALKVLKPGMDSAGVLTRFELERQALALMDHPCIAKVLDGGVTDESSRLGPGRPYFVMELVRGQPITEYCRERGIGIEERLELFLQVCDAVQHAHTKGLIHRDLKPSNILVSEVQGRPTPKVIDFGIAKAVASLKPEATMTLTGQFIGTPEYMSPEQAAGGAAGEGGAGGLDIDTRSDVYSLGVVLYKLLTGVLPFEPDELWKAGLLETLRVIREVEPPRPSQRLATIARSRLTAADAAPMPAAESPEMLARRLRGDLDWICMRALEKPRDRRYQSPGALAADIRRYLRTEPVEAGPPTFTYRAGKFVRRHKALVGAGAVAAAALVGGLGAALYGLSEARMQRDAAQAAEGVARIKQAEAEKQRGLAEERLAAAERERRRARTSFEFIGRAVGLNHPIGLEGEFTLRELVDQMAAEIDSDPDLEDVDAKVEVRLLVGELNRALGNIAGAERLLGEALNEMEAAGETGSPRHARAATQLARVRNDQRRHREAMDLLAPAVAALERLSAPDAAPVLAQARTTAGLALHRLGRWEEAVASLRSGIELMERVHGPEAGDLINPMMVLALILCERPDSRTEALEFAKEAAHIAERHAENRALTVAAQAALGRVARECGRLGLAREAYAESVRMAQQVKGLPRSTIALTQANLAILLRELGRGEEAFGLIEEALATRRAISPASPDTADAMDILAGLHADRGSPEDLAKAEALYREEIEILTQPDVGSDLAAARPRTGLADVLTRLGRFDEARREAEMALEARRRGLARRDWRIFSTQSVLAAAMAGLGQVEEAQDLMDEALRIVRADLGTTPHRLRPLLRRGIEVAESAGDEAHAEALKRELADLVDAPAAE